MMAQNQTLGGEAAGPKERSALESVWQSMQKRREEGFDSTGLDATWEDAWAESGGGLDGTLESVSDVDAP